MPTQHVSGITEEEIEEWEARAEKAGLSTSAWCRYRLRAGVRLWDAGGDFDIAEVQKRLDQHEPKSEPDDSTPTTDRFKQVIKRNLSIDEAMDRDEIEELISQEAVGKALSQLQSEGEIEYDAIKGGFIRK